MDCFKGSIAPAFGNNQRVDVCGSCGPRPGGLEGSGFGGNAMTILLALVAGVALAYAMGGKR